MRKTRTTTVWEKLMPSVINALIAIILSTPVYLYVGPTLPWKLSVILIFYLMQVAHTHEDIVFRCMGMKIFGTHWAKQYTRFQRNIYSILYTLSFSTLFFSIYFPFDLFLFNMFVLQLPSIYISGTTFHGLLAGGMVSKTSIRKH